MTEARTAHVRSILLALVLVLGACELAAFVDVPFVSEDWTHLAEMRPVGSLLSALDPRTEPLRPFQHAFFWILGHSGIDPVESTLPIAAHVFAFLLHAASCGLVWLLAREAGARGIGPWLAVALFACFPNVKSVAWSAAIGNPGRVCCELLALWAWVRHVDAPSGRRALLGLVAFVLALCWHESALLLPGILAAWIVFLRAEDVRTGLKRLVAKLSDPWILAFFALGLAYVAYLFLRPSRHHRAKSFDALPANVVKAATALCPEDLRTLIVEGFRAQAGLAFVVAGVLFALLALGTIVLWTRSRTARFVLAVVALELGLPALSTGFVQRYAYFASASVAIGLALWVTGHVNAPRGESAREGTDRDASARGPAARWIVVLVLGGLWARDALVDAHDYRKLGQRIPAWFEDLRAHRARVGDAAPIAIVDPPDMCGAEGDVPVFNWGLDHALEAHQIRGPWLLWRTRDYRTSSNVEHVDTERVRAAGEAGVPAIHRLELER